ncbi:MAG: hypothetical protein Q7R41_16635 [Phycisphaerales bacterium]|nr:hypothetical protein [Phycisphaerales bacterium]
MPPRIAVTNILMLLIVPARADDLLFRYEGDSLPYNFNPAWGIADPCDPPCSEAIENGHFLLFWPYAGNIANYYYRIARPPNLPPPTLWVEWRFRSNHQMPRTSFSCDARFYVKYGGMDENVWMYGDAAVSFLGDDFVAGLNSDEFHSFRFESLDGVNYDVSVDGTVFIVGWQNQPNGYHTLQFGGEGGCNGDKMPNTLNEWDFIRYGTISYGERIVASDPPDGFVDARQHAPLDRFTITFDSPNYVYLDDITVEVTDGVAPIPIQTRRLDNGPANVLEIVLDRPMPFNATTRFAFTDGVAENVVKYTFAPGDTNGDGRANLTDFATFQSCFGTRPIVGACLALDADANSAIDLADFYGFQRVFSAP